MPGLLPHLPLIFPPPVKITPQGEDDIDAVHNGGKFEVFENVDAYIDDVDEDPDEPVLQNLAG